MVAVGQLALAAVIAVATIYYAWQSNRLVREARASRLTDEEAWRSARVAEMRHELLQAANALVGAASDVVSTGSNLAILLRYRRVWRVQRVEPVNAAFAAASRALYRLRYVGAPEDVEAGEAVFDEVCSFYRLATQGVRQQQLKDAARRIAEAKSHLIEPIRARVSDPSSARDAASRGSL